VSPASHHYSLVATVCRGAQFGRVLSQLLQTVRSFERGTKVEEEARLEVEVEVEVAPKRERERGHS